MPGIGMLNLNGRVVLWIVASGATVARAGACLVRHPRRGSPNLAPPIEHRSSLMAWTPPDSPALSTGEAEPSV
jgi:hypothetical protein